MTSCAHKSSKWFYMASSSKIQSTILPLRHFYPSCCTQLWDPSTICFGQRKHSSKTETSSKFPATTPNQEMRSCGRTTTSTTPLHVPPWLPPIMMCQVTQFAKQTLKQSASCTSISQVMVVSLYFAKDKLKYLDASDLEPYSALNCFFLTVKRP